MKETERKTEALKAVEHSVVVVRGGLSGENILCRKLYRGNLCSPEAWKNVYVCLLYSFDEPHGHTAHLLSLVSVFSTLIRTI